MEFNFAENNVVDDINAVPEKYRGLYEEAEEEKFTLSEAAKGIVADYIGVNTTLNGLRVDKKKVTDENAQRRLATKAVEDYAASLGLDVGDEGVASTLKVYVEDLQSQVKGGKELKINLEKLNGDWERRINELEIAKNKEIVERDSALSRHLISDSASRALANAKGSIDLLLPHVHSSCKVHREEDGSYTVRVLDAQGDFRSDGSGGWMGVDGLVGEMKTQDKFARAFESEDKSGTGSPPGGMKRQLPIRQEGEALSPTEKIARGLSKGQHRSGHGAGSLIPR